MSHWGSLGGRTSAKLLVFSAVFRTLAANGCQANGRLAVLHKYNNEKKKNIQLQQACLQLGPDCECLTIICENQKRAAAVTSLPVGSAAVGRHAQCWKPVVGPRQGGRCDASAAKTRTLPLLREGGGVWVRSDRRRFSITRQTNTHKHTK